MEGHYRSEIQAITVLNAIDKFVGGKSSVATKTKEHYESSLSLLVKADPNKPLHTFTVSNTAFNNGTSKAMMDRH